MKIVYTRLPDDNIGYAAKKLFNAIHWHPMEYPVYDMLEEIKPDIVFISEHFLTPVVINALNEYSPKVVLFGQGVPMFLDIDVLVASPTTTEVMRKNLTSIDYKTLYLKESADVVNIWAGKEEQHMKCQIGIISEDKYDMEEKISVAGILAHSFKMKIVGDMRIPLPQYLGTVSGVGLSSFIKSADIILDFRGNYLLDVAANGGFCISNVPNSLYPYVSFKDTNNLLFNIDYYLKGKELINISKDASQKVLESDTSYHRLVEILDACYSNSMPLSVVFRGLELPLDF